MRNISCQVHNTYVVCLLRSELFLSTGPNMNYLIYRRALEMYLVA
jgi:hypothetical protein